MADAGMLVANCGRCGVVAAFALASASACTVSGAVSGDPRYMSSASGAGAAVGFGGAGNSAAGSFGNPQGGVGFASGGVGNVATGGNFGAGGLGAGGMSVTGGGGLGAGGSNAGGASAGGTGSAQTCGFTPGYTGPLLGRCDAASCSNGLCGIVHAQGGFLTLDDFEGAAVSAPPIAIHWPARDGRVGSWQKFADPSANSKAALEASGGGGSPDSKQALHFSGGAGPWGASVALPIGNCYDASAYDGISFWLKGNAGAGNATVKFNLQTPPTEPTLTGGSCTANCSDHFGKVLDVPATWTRVKVPWSDLKRGCTPTTPPVPANFDPQKMILALSFQQIDPTKGFDYFIDDITFDLDNKTVNNLGDILTEPIYGEMFKTALPVFSYSGLVSAASSYGQGTFAQAGTALDRKHEVAAFLGQVTHETGSLTIVREAACYPTHTAACTVTDNYFGRGAIQLTYDANYAAADSTFPGIHANPDLVATNTAFAFGTGIWFWMNKGCHGQIMGQNFGGTTNIINGGLECGGGPANPTGAADRASLYTQFCAALGINARGTLGC
jgi:predicted chitinase